MSGIQPVWPAGPSAPELEAGVAHLWCAALDLTPAEERQRADLLAPDERARAARYLVEAGRVHFTAARSTLRTILARYLRVAPAELIFSYSERGKPSLAPPFAATGLSFNLSHSHGLAVIAIVRAAAVGVDVEQVRHLSDIQRLAERFFAPSEQVAIQQAPEERRPMAFFRIWTCKEAFLKADGDGLSFPLDQIEVLPGPDGLIFARRRGAPAATVPWAISMYTPAPGYLAALALPGEQWRIECWSI